MLSRIKTCAGALMNSSALRAADRTSSRRNAFVQDERGNIAIMTAFTLTMLLIGIGAAFDYTRAIQRNNDLQNVVDAAVLAGASIKDKDAAYIEEQVRKIVDGYNTQGLELKVDVDVDDDRVYLSVQNAPSSIFGSLTNRQSVPLLVESAAPRAQDTPVHLSLVLDTTGSMQGANLAAMQTATTDLLDEMEKLPAGTRVSIVPFGNYVNIGTTSTTPRPWLDRGRDGEIDTICAPEQIETTAPTCTTESHTYTRYRDGLNMGVVTEDRTTCSGGTYTDGPEVCQDRTYTWNGCMGSRLNGMAEVSDFRGRRFPAALDRNCGTELMPLGSDFDAMRAMVSGLTTSGSTYLPSGLSWGWRTLTPRMPYPQSASMSGGVSVPINPGSANGGNGPQNGSGNGRPRLNRAMLFMTDGLNNRSIDGTDPSGNVTLHDGNDGQAGLDLSETICENIREDGIDLFVVAYRVPGQTDTVEMLENCASSPGHFFTPDNATELKSAFREVAQMLESTRILF